MFWALLFISILVYFVWCVRRKLSAVYPETRSEDGLCRRKLGDLYEAFGYVTCEKGNLLLSNALFVVSKKIISVDVMKKALTRAGKRHPLLRSRVARDIDGSLHWEEMKHFKPNFTVASTPDWHEIYEQQLMTLYDSEIGPLWRVAYLPNVPPTNTSDGYPYEYAFVFGFRHDILDGTSYVKIFNQFLDDIEHIQAGGSDEVPSQSMPPPLDTLVQKPTVIDCVIVTLFEHILMFTWIRKKISRIMSSKFPPNLWIKKFGVEIDRNPLAEVKTSFVPLSFTTEQTSALLKACKQNGATMQSAVQTAAHISVADIFAEGSMPEEFIVKAAVTVNLRGVMKEEFEDQCHHVAAYFGGIQIPTRVTSAWQTEFWDLAKVVSNRIHHNLREECLITIKMMRILGKFMLSGLSIDIIRKEFAGRFDVFMAFTNLGNCNSLSKRNGILKCVGRYGSSSEHKVGNIFANNLMTVDAKLFWTITYYPNITRKDVAEKYAEGIKSVIRQVTNESGDLGEIK